MPSFDAPPGWFTDDWWTFDGVPPGSPGGKAGGAFLPDVFGTAARQIVEIAPGADLAADPSSWQWVEITTYVQWNPGITVQIGYKSEAPRLVPAELTAKLRNDQAGGGYFTLDNPLSPYRMRENTPLRAQLDVGNGPSIRFYGYTTSLTPKESAGRREAMVLLTAHGVSRRLSKGTSAALSPMYRWHMLSGNYPTDTNQGWPSADQMYHGLPAHYWPLEESSGALQGANVIDPAYPLIAAGTGQVPQFGADRYLPGVKSLAQFNTGSTLAVNFPLVPIGGHIEQSEEFFIKGTRIQFLVRVEEGTQQQIRDSLGDLLDSTIGRLLTINLASGGSAEKITIFFDNDPANITGGLLLYADTFNSAGASVGGGRIGGTNDIQWERGAYITLDIVDTVLDMEIRFTVMPLTVSPTSAFPESGVVSLYDFQTLAATNIIGITGFIIGEGEYLGGAAVGQLSVYNGAAGTFPERYPHALLGRPGDTVAERLYRLGVEGGVQIEIVGDPSDIPMGPQSTAGYTDLLAECAAVDLGTLLDGLGPGYTYIARSHAYANAAALTLDYARSDLLQADGVHDDQLRVNDYTATSGAGSSQRFTQPDGALGTDTVGTYDTSGEHRAAFDGDLYQIAAWKVGQGTIPGLRYPALKFNLAKPVTSRLAQRWLDAMPADRIDALGVAQYPTADRSLLLRGWVERWNSKVYEVIATLLPYDGYGVVTLSPDTGGTDEYLGWLDVDTVTTAAELAAGGTSVVVTVTGPVLTNATTPSPTYADDLVGLYVNLDGMRVGVTAITGAASPQTLTLTGTDVLRLVPIGASVTAWDPARPGL